MKRWALLIVGYGLVLGATATMLYLAWEWVGLLTVLLVGFGLASSGKQLGRAQDIQTWEPKNYAQVAERLWKLHDYGVEQSHKAVSLAKGSTQGGEKERTPIECWQLIASLHDGCPSEIKDVVHYVMMGLKTLRGEG